MFEINKLDLYGEAGKLLKEMLIIEDVKRREFNRTLIGYDVYYRLRCPLCSHKSKIMRAINGKIYEQDFAGGLKIHLFRRHNFGEFFETWRHISGYMAWRCKKCGKIGYGVLEMLQHYIKEVIEE